MTYSNNESPFDELLEEVEYGKKGVNKGLSMGLPKLYTAIDGIQRRRYDLLFGAEGSGKSGLAWMNFIMFPYLDYVENRSKHNYDYQVRLYSLEVSRKRVLAKMFCWYLYQKKGVLIDVKHLLSVGDNEIHPDVEKYMKMYKNFFKDMDKHITIIDQEMTPSQLKADVVAFAKRRGTFGKRIRKGVEEITYTPYDPNEMVSIITDTLGNLSLEAVGGMMGKKPTIDLHSTNCRYTYRNQLGYHVLNVTHSNRDIDNIQRVRYGEIFPKKGDILDSGQPARDANLVICIFNPNEYRNPNNTLDKFLGYEIPTLKERFRSIGILKSRDGDNFKKIGLQFLGEIGNFTEMKPSREMTNKDYARITGIKKTYRLNTKK